MRVASSWSLSAYVIVGAQAPATHVNRDPRREAVEPDYPTVLRTSDSQLEIIRHVGPSTGRRAALARWLTRPDHPLTARVIANRIWQWHFGQALASTPNDLGTQGEPPSHPELLDWLASELRENGWSLKGLHRRILLSSTYRQSAIRDAKAIAVDPQNRLLAGFPRRRLEAEEVWDHLHTVAGTLDRKPFGPPFVPKLSSEELQGMYDLENKLELKWPVTAEQSRRAIYILNRRSFRFPFFEAFDPPSTATSCPSRQATTVPAQALTLLNNGIVGGLARVMAERLSGEAGADGASFVRRAWLLAYSRDADDGEVLPAHHDHKDPREAPNRDCLGSRQATRPRPARRTELPRCEPSADV